MIEFVDSPAVVMDATKLHVEYSDGEKISDAVNVFLEQFATARGTIEIDSDYDSISVDFNEGCLEQDIPDELGSLLITGGDLTIYGRTGTHKLNLYGVEALD